jgi:hypothetical protein
MDEFLTKPVAAAALLGAGDRLASALGVSRLSRADVETSGGPVEPGAVLSVCGGDEEGLRGLCEEFRINAPARLAESAAAEAGEAANRRLPLKVAEAGAGRVPQGEAAAWCPAQAARCLAGVEERHVLRRPVEVGELHDNAW